MLISEALGELARRAPHAILVGGSAGSIEALKLERVPQAEYDKVKADKLDNGLIDEAVVGEKRRGELDVDYRIAVAGGAITEW